MKLLTTLGIFLLLQLNVQAQVRMDAENNLSINHAGGQIGSATFTLSEQAEGYGGMYINSNAATTKWPFYGYATDNVARAWHYYDDGDKTWRLNVGGDRFQVSQDTSWFLNNISGLQGFQIAGNSGPALKVNASDGLLLNTSTRFNVFTDFTLNSTSNTFGGMMINVNDTNSGKPFYGYAINGSEKAFTFYEPSAKSLNTFVGDENILTNITEAFADRFLVNGRLLMNSATQVGTFTDFTLRSLNNTWGGMYIDVDGQGAERPFYGYSVKGVSRAYHHFSKTSDSWILTIEDVNGNGNEIIEAGQTFLSVNGYTILNNPDAHPGSSTGPAGTIYYTDGHFYGKINATTFRQLDNTTMSPYPPGDDPLYAKLKSENKAMRSELEALRSELKLLSESVKSLKSLGN